MTEHPRRLPTLRPRSLSGLILIGFAAIALPLLLGTFNAAVEMRSLSTASERLVTNGVAATQYTQSIVRQVASLERTARLYQILRRASLLQVFRQNRDLLVQTTLPVTEVALAAGFASASHFSRLYSAAFGHAPSRERTSGIS